MKLKDIESKFNMFSRASLANNRKKSSKKQVYEVDMNLNSEVTNNGVELEELIKILDELKADLRSEFPGMNKVQELKTQIEEGKKDH
jgi:hypothetical protein